MFAARNLQRNCFRTLSSLLQSNPTKDVMLFKDVAQKQVVSNVILPNTLCEESYVPLRLLNSPFNGWFRTMSTSKGRSMRSKVERRMQKESGKTSREIRRAKKIKKKLMTDEERLIYNLKRAKKKVALLLQKLKKYELPELPPPIHDPELLTTEQLQAYKKIGFRNKNYVPVGVRGVFGGVVQNMHLHWKFHETVQVCCDNFPKEKIKQMATMLARLSGGIVVNIHNVKTIIMFRGRNYRQPKNLIPINTLTKRKALFKARFEQALESQKLNIKKIEQELRRKGINPEDPVAMASVQRVASTFFNAIDEKEGSPYVFHGYNKMSDVVPITDMSLSEPPDDSDQEDLDNFIAEIEDAADREWAEEEAAEEKELGRIRYWNREEIGGRSRRGNNYSDDEVRESRGWKDRFGKGRTSESDDEDADNSEGNDEWDSGNAGVTSDYDSEEAHNEFKRSRVERGKWDKVSRSNTSAGFKRTTELSYGQKRSEVDSESENILSDLDNAMWESDGEEEHDSRSSKVVSANNFRSSSDEKDESYSIKGNERVGMHDYESSSDDEFKTFDTADKKQDGSSRDNFTEAKSDSRRKITTEGSISDDVSSDSEIAMWESDSEEESGAERYDFRGNVEQDYHPHINKGEKNEAIHRITKTPKEVDETWDSD
ncbi:hypothetical protein SLE2022_193940 [Rubroshorea leprosula]